LKLNLLLNTNIVTSIVIMTHTFRRPY